MTPVEHAPIPGILLGVLLGGMLVAMVLMYIQKEREIRRRDRDERERREQAAVRLDAALRAAGEAQISLADALREVRQ